MSQVLHVRTKVLPGKRVEVSLPDFTVGDEVEVTIAQKQSVTPSRMAEQLAYFQEWVRRIPARPGPRVDASRDSIYES
jgi:hypothetical protein